MELLLLYTSKQFNYVGIQSLAENMFLFSLHGYN